MKQWWMWFILSGVWVLAALLNVWTGRSPVVIGYDVLAALLLAALALVQKKGNKRTLRWACIGTIAALVIFLLVVLLT